MIGKESKYLILFYDGVLNNKNMFNKDKDYSYVYSQNILYLKEVIEKKIFLYNRKDIKI